MDDCKDPFASGHTYGLGDALWDAKKINYGSAQALGLPRDMVLTPNHVYLDQCLPGLLATKEGQRRPLRQAAIVPRPERGGMNHCLEARGNLPNDLYAQPP